MRRRSASTSPDRPAPGRSRRRGPGWLIRVVHPLPWDGPEPGAGGSVERELLASITWAGSVPEAVRRARAEGKLVLACVRSEFDPQKTSFLEQILLAAVLADPDVLALVIRRFVPVRVSGNPALYTMDAGRPGAKDPLAGLGTSIRDEKATALVVSDGERRVAGLTNIGTFDRDLVLRLLQGALARAAACCPGAMPGRCSPTAGPTTPGALFARMGGPEGEYGLARAASLRATMRPRSATPCRSPGPMDRSAPRPRPRRAVPCCGWGDPLRRCRCSARLPAARPVRDVGVRARLRLAPGRGAGGRPAPPGGTRPPGSRARRRPPAPGPAWPGPRPWPCTRT